MLPLPLPVLAATGPERPEPPPPREPGVAPPGSAPPTPPERELERPPEPVTWPDPGPEPDVPDGPSISDPDLAPGAPLAPPAPSPAPREEPDEPPERDFLYDTASLPPDHPAYDRVQDFPDDYGGRRSRLLPLFVGLLLVLAGLLITYFILRPDTGTGEVPDLLVLAAAHADDVQLDLATSDLDEAQRYILDEFGWPVRVPVLPDARLAGVGVVALTAGVEVPVLVYQPDEGVPVTVYAYDYAFLDAASDYLRLAPPVFARLAEEPPVDVRRVGARYLVLWRRRAAIYTAVTADDPAALVEYLSHR